MRIQLKRDTTANWTTNGTMVPLAGEICIDITTGQFKIGDGTTTYAALPYAAVANPMTAEGDLIVGAAGGAMDVLAHGNEGGVLTTASGTPAWSDVLDCGSSSV